MIRNLNYESVLLKEADNPNNVYLYLDGDFWCAYEKSAYYLSVIKSVILEKEVFDNSSEVVLLKAQFNKDDMCLPLSPGVVLRLVSDDTLQFSFEKELEGFNEWKQQQLDKLSA